jgi:hypothetical protein
MNSDILGLGVVGVIGLCAGMAMNGFEGSCSFSIRNRGIIFGCLALCIYFMGYLDRNVMSYSVGIMIVLKLLYDLAKTVNLRARMSRPIILFGQYTLVCYIMQIIFLQGLSWMLSRQRWGLGYQTISIFVATNMFLLGLCGLVKFLRGRYESMDKAYRFIFS